MSVAGFDSQRATARPTPFAFLRLGLWTGVVAVVVATYLAFAVWVPYRQTQATAAQIVQLGGDFKTQRGTSWERRAVRRVGFDSPVFERVSGIDLANTPLRDADLGQLPALATVRGMSLAGTAISNDALRFLSNSRELASLDLRNTRVSSAGLSHLAHLDRLTHLNLNGTDVGDSAIRQLKALPMLGHLALAGTQITPSGLKDISQIELHTLDLDAAALTRQTVAELQKLTSFYGLGLFATRDGDRALTHARDLRDITHLHLVGNGFTDAGVEQLEDLRTLRELRLEKTAMSPAAIERLQQSLPECVIEQVTTREK